MLIRAFSREDLTGHCKAEPWEENKKQIPHILKVIAKSESSYLDFQDSLPSSLSCLATQIS
jgi:hypothetical protein